MGKHITTEEFIKKAQAIWGDRFDYSNAQYIDLKTKVEIRCKKHDKTFFQTPNEHYKSKSEGCDICRQEKKQEKQSEFVKLYLGEKYTNKQGFKFKIIGGTCLTDLTVQYENGYIKEHVKLCEIRESSVYSKKMFLGKTSVSTCGQTMKIINWRRANDIDIQFCDGGIAYHKHYSAFLKGNIENPNFKRINNISRPELMLAYYFSQLGFVKIEKRTMREINGLELDMYCADINGCKIAIEYDGYPWHKNKEKDIIKNSICTKAGIFLYRVREPNLPDISDKNTKLYFLKTHKPTLSDIQIVTKNIIEDINLRCNTSLTVCITPDDEKDIKAVIYTYYDKFRCQRIGEKRIMHNGMEAEIIAYRDASDIDVKFVGTNIIKKNATYDTFKKGHIAFGNVNTQNKNLQSQRVGEQALANNGQLMTIVEYFSEKNMTIKFVDGATAENISYSNFKKGSVQNPNLPQLNKPKAISLIDTDRNETICVPSIEACGRFLNVSAHCVRNSLKRGYYKNYKVQFAT